MVLMVLILLMVLMVLVLLIVVIRLIAPGRAGVTAGGLSGVCVSAGRGWP